MDTQDYLKVVNDAFSKLEALQQQRETIDAETMKLEQLISATANMLPDQQKEWALRRMATLQQLYRVREYGLTEAIRIALESKAGQWMTVSAVRDQLIALGFDFSDYTTNPLASVSAVLRRLKDDEVNITTVDGVAAYSWKQSTRAEKAEAVRKALLGRTSANASLPLPKSIPDVIEDALKGAFKKK